MDGHGPCFCLDIIVSGSVSQTPAFWESPSTSHHLLGRVNLKLSDISSVEGTTEYFVKH